MELEKNTPKAKFIAQSEEYKQTELMEVVMNIYAIFNGMEEREEIDPKTYDGYYKDALVELAREFVYEFYGTDEYNNDMGYLMDPWLTDKLTKLFPSRESEITLITYLSDIIKNYHGDDNLAEITIKGKVAIDWFYTEEKGDEQKSFWEWYRSDYTADDTIGLYDWLLENNKEFKVTGTIRR